MMMELTIQMDINRRF